MGKVRKEAANSFTCELFKKKKKKTTLFSASNQNCFHVTISEGYQFVVLFCFSLLLPSPLFLSFLRLWRRIRARAPELGGMEMSATC